MRSSIFAAAGFASAMSCACAAAAESPWYLSGDLGAVFRDQDSLAATFHKTADPSITAQGTLKEDFDPGLSAHLALGYRVKPRLRLEGELGVTGYRGSTIYPSTTDPAFPRLNGSPWTPSRAPDFHRLSAAVNAFYDFRALGPFTPYVGLGLGAWDARSASGAYSKPGGGAFTAHGGSRVEAFGQVEAGVSLRLSRHWSVAPAYRIVRALARDRETDNLLKVGLCYAF